MEVKNYSGREVYRKYAGINQRGRTLLRRGEVVEFTGFPESFQNRINASLIYTPESVEVFDRYVLQKVAKIGEEEGIQFRLAKKDELLHSTILDSDYLGDDPDEREGIFSDLVQSEDWKKITEQLKGLELTFQYILLDGRNLILTCADIPSTVVEARSELSGISKSYGLVPRDMSNILHITLGRMTQLPADEKNGNFSSYVEKIRNLRHEISEKPLVLITDKPLMERAGLK